MDFATAMTLRIISNSCPEQNRLRGCVGRPGGTEERITRDFTDDGLALGDLAALAYDLYQRYRVAFSD